ncbi:MAG: Fic family protein [Coxiellaceae bacterium]|nr:Fic family protein [Coxiellaceae bacterium]
MRNALYDELNQYPNIELWRLFVDGKFHFLDRGFATFEAREPGCLKRFLQALIVLGENFDDKTLSVELMQKVHRYAMPEGGKFRLEGQDVQFPLIPSTFSEAGLKEFMGAILIEAPQAVGSALVSQPCPKSRTHTPFIWKTVKSPEVFRLDKNILYAHQLKYGRLPIREVQELIYAYSKSATVVIISEFASLDKFNNRVNHIIQSYNAGLDDSELKDDALLRHIVKHIQALEQLHPFPDGNNRTFINLLLVRLLVQHGFGIPTFYEPNAFDAHSVDECVTIVKESIQNTETLKRTGELFDFSTQLMCSAESKNQWREICNSVRLDRFRESYNMLWHSALFTNPLSKMRKVRDPNVPVTMEEIEQHVGNNPNSRSAIALEQAQVPVTSIIPVQQ